MGELVPGMAYLVRRLLENTSNESFVRHRFAENWTLDDLIAAPEVGELPSPAPLARRPATAPASPSPYEPEPTAEWRREPVRHDFSLVLDAEATVERGVPPWLGRRLVRTGVQP